VWEKKCKKRKKRNMLNTIEQTVKTLNFNTITKIVMDDDEGTKNKKHIDDHISQSKMKNNLKIQQTKCKSI
jgi:hypothetical protein